MSVATKSTWQNSLWADALRRFKRDRVGVISFLIIVVYATIALLTMLGVLCPDVSHTDNSASYLPPSAEHWMGTDIFGRDVFAKAIHGTRTAIFIGLIASGIAIPIGVVLGALAGYFGGVVDEIITWFYTTIDSIPGIILLIALIYALGPGISNAYIAIGMTSWVTLCRLMRAEVMKQKQKEFVVAACAVGGSHMRRLFIHILPNTFHIVLIQFSLRFVYAIKSEVILSYLGLGVEPGNFSWGVMIDDAKMELARGVWWQLAAAAGFMFVVVLAFNLFNDALRDALDPKLKNK